MIVISGLEPLWDVSDTCKQSGPVDSFLFTMLALININDYTSTREIFVKASGLLVYLNVCV